jgi:hypothetical protein
MPDVWEELDEQCRLLREAIEQGESRERPQPELRLIRGGREDEAGDGA